MPGVSNVTLDEFGTEPFARFTVPPSATLVWHLLSLYTGVGDYAIGVRGGIRQRRRVVHRHAGISGRTRKHRCNGRACSLRPQPATVSSLQALVNALLFESP
jgi:hypothetical protein